MTEPEFRELEREDKYWKGRWDYFKEAIDIAESGIEDGSVNSVLEVGPYKRPLVRGSDVMDKNPHCPDAKHRWDATETPWPIGDNEYDLFIALQVWEHLGDKQKEAFGEVMRTSKKAVLSFPYNWNLPGNCHDGITDEKIAEWTSRIGTCLL